MSFLKIENFCWRRCWSYVVVHEPDRCQRRGKGWHKQDDQHLSAHNNGHNPVHWKGSLAFVYVRYSVSYCLCACSETCHTILPAAGYTLSCRYGKLWLQLCKSSTRLSRIMYIIYAVCWHLHYIWYSGSPLSCSVANCVSCSRLSDPCAVVDRYYLMMT